MEIYEALGIDFEKSIWQVLDNTDEGAPTYFAFHSLPFS